MLFGTNQAFLQLSVMYSSLINHWRTDIHLITDGGSRRFVCLPLDQVLTIKEERKPLLSKTVASKTWFNCALIRLIQAVTRAVILSRTSHYQSTVEYVVDGTACKIKWQRRQRQVNCLCLLHMRCTILLLSVQCSLEDAPEQRQQPYYPHYNLQDVGLPLNLASLRQIQNLPGSWECYT